MEFVNITDYQNRLIHSKKTLSHKRQLYPQINYNKSQRAKTTRTSKYTNDTIGDTVITGYNDYEVYYDIMLNKISKKKIGNAYIKRLATIKKISEHDIVLYELKIVLMNVPSSINADNELIDMFTKILKELMQKYINTLHKKYNRLIIYLNKIVGNNFITGILSKNNFILVDDNEKYIKSLKERVSGSGSNSESASDSDSDKYIYMYMNKDYMIKENVLPPVTKYKWQELGYTNFYIISAGRIEGLIYNPLQNYLINHGLVENVMPECKPFLLWNEMMENMKFNVRYNNTKCYLMNLVSDSKKIITNKSTLYFNFKKQYPDKYKNYFAETWNLKELRKDIINNISNSGKIYIVRPAGKGAYSGKDIYIVNNRKKLEKAIINTKKYANVIISEYIENPLLFHGKKFHLRIYYLIGIINNKFINYVMDFYKILTAQLRYKKGEYDDKMIHDTHFETTLKDYIYPIAIDKEDTNFYNNINTTYMPKIKECLKMISAYIKDEITIYPETINGFEVFGCDFMIDTNGKIYLLEINDKVGYKCKNIKTTYDFSKIYFNKIINLIINPLINN